MIRPQIVTGFFMSDRTPVYNSATIGDLYYEHEYRYGRRRRAPLGCHFHNLLYGHLHGEDVNTPYFLDDWRDPDGISRKYNLRLVFSS